MIERWEKINRTGTETNSRGRLVGLVVLAIAGFAIFNLFAGQGNDLVVERNISDPVYPGETVQVTLTLESSNTVKNVSIRERTDGFEVVSAPGGEIHNESVSWYVDSFQGTRTVTYTLSVPPERYQPFNITGTYENGAVKNETAGENRVRLDT
jgi:hypothetical protein